MLVSVENATLHKYVVQNGQNKTRDYFRDSWKFYPNLKPQLLYYYYFFKIKLKSAIGIAISKHSKFYNMWQ